MWYLTIEHANIRQIAKRGYILVWRAYGSGAISIHSKYPHKTMKAAVTAQRQVLDNLQAELRQQQTS